MNGVGFREILTPHNRGILFDVFTFVVNLLLMTVLTNALIDIFYEARAGNPAAYIMSGLFCFGIYFGFSCAAILKRRSDHLRNPDLHCISSGFLWLYYISQIVLGCVISFQLVEDLNVFFSPEDLIYKILNPVFGGFPLLAIINSSIFYFYFYPPKHKPFLKFLESPRAVLLGDVSIFFNMIFHQMLWGLIITELLKISNEIGFRLCLFLFLGLFFYLPFRLFYLGKDGRRKLPLATMLLALSPIIIRIFFAP